MQGSEVSDGVVVSKLGATVSLTAGGWRSDKEGLFDCTDYLGTYVYSTWRSLLYGAIFLKDSRMYGVGSCYILSVYGA